MRQLEKGFKRAAVRAIPLLYPPRPARGPLRRLLLVRVDDRLGNLVLLTPALEWLRAARPDLAIEVLASRAFSSLLTADPRIDRLRIIDKDRQKRYFPTFFDDLHRAGGGDFDAAIECRNRETFSFSSALYTGASRAPIRIGFANRFSSAYLSEGVPGDESRIHAAYDPLILAAHLLGERTPSLEGLPLRVHLPPIAPTWEGTLDRLPGRPETRIGIHVGGRGAKRWPLERFVELASGLLEGGFHPWIFSGPAEAGAEGSFSALTRPGLGIVPRADVVALAHAFARCGLVIAPDTGPMHLASAVGTPTLALFLDSPLERYRPYGPRDSAIDARGRDLEAREVLRSALMTASGA